MISPLNGDLDEVIGLRNHTCEIRYLVKYPFIESSSRSMFPNAAPLLEEERNISFLALALDRLYPLRLHRYGPWSRFSSDYHPVDIGQGQILQRPDQRLAG